MNLSAVIFFWETLTGTLPFLPLGNGKFVFSKESDGDALETLK